MTEVMEIARFKTLEGQDARAAAAGVDAWLAARPGFVARVVLGPDAEGYYTDLVRWRSADDAHAAMAEMEQSADAAAFLAALDPSSVEMRHLPVVHVA